MSRRGRPARGLTLIELMVAIAITALLALAALPAMGDYIANSRLREGGNLLLTQTLFAQSEALKRNATIRVTVSGASVEVTDRTDPAKPEVLRTSALPAPVSVTGTVFFDIGSDGRPFPFGTAPVVNVGLAGGTCSADRRCPGLRVDAGGAVRLCADHTSGCT